MSSIIEKISKDKPTGKDYKYEDSYLVIEAEIDKTMSASSVGEVDWKLIQQSCEVILKNESKDLKIASYWLYAQWRLLSLDGLTSSLPIYIELLKTYKLKLFPKSKKVKLRILEWLEESLSVAIMPIMNEIDEEQLKVLVLNLELLEATIIEVFEEELTLFSSLLRKIKKKSQEKETLK
jgi:type VI secretion system protein VasJ